MAKKNELTLKNFTLNKENPFIAEAVENIKVVRKTQVMRPKNSGEIQMIVSEAGEVEGYTQFLRYVEVDEEQFAKVYLSQFTAFWDLPKSAIRVFGYILSVLKPKNDRFEFILEECIKYTKYKGKPQVYEGLAALIANGIIARGYHEYVYFINPLVVFNGDRVTFAKTYIKKKRENNPNQLGLFQSEARLTD